MIRRGTLVFLTALQLAAGACPGDAQTPLKIERVYPPAALERLRSRGESLAGAPMSAAETRALDLRTRRWHGTRDLVTAPGVNWSKFASRRAGWRPPSPRLPFDATGAAAPAGTVGPPDTLRVALLRVDFLTDREPGKSTGNGRFDLSGPDTTQVPIDRPPRNRTFYAKHLEALRRYYDAESYGRVVVEGTVWPATEDSAYHVSDMADFGPWMFSTAIYEAAVHMFRTMLFAADSQSTLRGDRIPWDAYDRFIIVHAGGDLQSDLRQDSPLDIPSFTLGVIDTDMVVFPDSTTRPIDRASFIPETNNQDGYFGAINGVMAHECGHLFFGYVDVYDIETGIPVVGFWSLMDSGNLTGARIGLADGSEIFATGLLPPSIDPFQRQFAGDGLIAMPMAYGDTITLRDSERFPDLRRVDLSSDEYLLIENRYIEPTPFVELDQDSATRVVLGPMTPDRYEYDALLPVRTLPDDTPLPSGGALVWHIDESVMPLEYAFPLDTSLRVNPDFGVNSNPFRRGISVIEADGLGDLGDPGSPYLFGAPLDPFFLNNYASLSDTTEPNLIPHIGTRPHVRLDFLDDPGTTMRMAGFRVWQLPGWPVAADFPPGGPQLLAVDADGDRALEACWAGGGVESPDSTALFALRVDGSGLFGPAAFALMDRRPRPLMAALATGVSPGPGLPQAGPALFAVSTIADGPDTSTAGGRVWLVDHFGQTVPGWPPPLPSVVTTPPVISGFFPTATVYVGCADGHVYAMDLDGNIVATSDVPLAGGVSGRLAVSGDLVNGGLVAAGGASGSIAVFDAATLAVRAGWPVETRVATFSPDFLWLRFDGAGSVAAGQATCTGNDPQLVAHDGATLWAFCAGGEVLPGWGRGHGAPLVGALGAGDPDGDGLPEVLTQSTASWVGFVNRTGDFSPGWPKRGTDEDFLTTTPALSVDVDGDGIGELVAMNASGIVRAFRRDGQDPSGWPLASGSGTRGAPVAADLDLNGTLELVVPDHLGRIYAYSLPASSTVGPGGAQLTANAWPMVGGDPGRSSTLPAARTTVAPAASAGPLVRGSFKAYPNPARFSAVKFAFQLTEPADVEFRIFDTSGHMVTSFRRDAGISDNLVVWEPGHLPAGLYVAKVRFTAASGAQDASIPVGLLR